jgi:YidC/Oxa1 family membrane protein insertase
MFELSITLDGGRSMNSLNFNGAAYTLGFGPQSGPTFEKLDEQRDYRHFIYYTNGSLKTERPGNKPITTRDMITWGGIAGKYFTLLVVPDTAPYAYTYTSQPADPALVATSRFFIERPALNVARDTNTLRFYLGPKDQKILARYDNGQNAFGYNGLGIEKASNTPGFWSILSPLETLLKWIMGFFYMLIPNYGVAIIFLTLVVKLVLFPLTKKGSEGTLKMQAISPRIKELQDKYKDNPTKMQTEMAKIYKEEGYNPMSGCLPLLIQMPIFFAMYNMFNNHFDLRGAMFIPGWIPDLSAPEHFINFGFTVPFLGWDSLHLLPFVYVGSQILYTKVTQTPDMQSNKQMKMMMYLMPVMFFFILYNMPTGLEVYWIFSNVFTMVQQLLINRYMAKKKAEMGIGKPGAGKPSEPKKPVALPPKAKKGKK